MSLTSKRGAEERRGKTTEQPSGDRGSGGSMSHLLGELVNRV